MLDHSERAATVQEERLGAEQVALVKILQTHGVVVRGGAEHGRKLVDALLVCRTLLLAENHASYRACPAWLYVAPLAARLLNFWFERVWSASRPNPFKHPKGLVCKQTKPFQTPWKQQDALDMQKAWRQEYVEEERKD